MALIGLPPLASLTTLEMTPEQYQRFRKSYLQDQVRELMWDGVTREVAIHTAKNNLVLEERRGDSAFAERNNAIRNNRRTRARRQCAAGK